MSYSSSQKAIKGAKPLAPWWGQRLRRKSEIAAGPVFAKADWDEF